MGLNAGLRSQEPYRHHFEAAPAPAYVILINFVKLMVTVPRYRYFVFQSRTLLAAIFLCLRFPLVGKAIIFNGFEMVHAIIHDFAKGCTYQNQFKKLLFKLGLEPEPYSNVSAPAPVGVKKGQLRLCNHG